MSASLVVHGHFYQPPRENPWTAYIDGEPSAHPFPHWNARIQAECYRANAFSRILDAYGRVERIVNNYAHMSFNFGPTLLSWMEVADPLTYGRLIEADRESVERRGGHGNAIAQGFNHAILPLCNERDRVTQVRWGMSDFRHRFGREPEGIWLPETACNDATLGTLIDEGLAYTILSPYQAARIKPLAGGEWEDMADGKIDPRRPYRYFHRDGSGRSLALFFYDGRVARSIAFEGGLASSAALVDRFVQAGSEDQRIIHVATDGESYGHHFHHGDRTLAHALTILAAERGLQITNYGEFLANHPPEYEVEVLPGPDGEGTAWSCAHGVGRWHRDCGCNTGGEPHWNQAWRGPLRWALDHLRDSAAAQFEAQAGELFKEPWAARDGYVALVLDRAGAEEAFFAQHAQRSLSEPEKVRALTLMELQHNAMLMYTSCGWFFSELSGIETVQVMKYAGRVMDLMGELEMDSRQERFLEILSEARSNVPEHGNGADVYRRFAESARVPPARIAAHLGISGLVTDELEQNVTAGYQVERQDSRTEKTGRVTLSTCRLLLTSEATSRTHDFAMAAMHFGGVDFYCALSPYPGGARFRGAVKRLWERYPSASLPAILRLVEKEFGVEEYGLEHVLPGLRRLVANSILGDLVRFFSEQFTHMFEENRRIIEMLQETGAELPNELRTAAEFTLAKRFVEEIRAQCDSYDPDAFQKAVDIAEEMARHRTRISDGEADEIFANMITGAVEQAIAERQDDQWTTAGDLLALSRRLRLQPVLDRPQELLYEALNHDGLPLTDAIHQFALRLRLAPSALGADRAQSSVA